MNIADATDVARVMALLTGHDVDPVDAAMALNRLTKHAEQALHMAPYTIAYPAEVETIVVEIAQRNADGDFFEYDDPHDLRPLEDTPTGDYL